MRTGGGGRGSGGVPLSDYGCDGDHATGPPQTPEAGSRHRTVTQPGAGLTGSLRCVMGLPTPLPCPSRTILPPDQSNDVHRTSVPGGAGSDKRSGGGGGGAVGWGDRAWEAEREASEGAKHRR